MSALEADRKTDQYGTRAVPDLLSFAVAAATLIYGGALVATNSSGYALGATATNTLKVWGVAEKQVDNSDGAAGDAQVLVRQGVFPFDNGDSITIADRGKLCYAGDDHTVYKSDSAGTRPVVGKIIGLDPITSQILVAVGTTSLWDENEGAQPVGGIGQKIVKGVVYNNQADLTAFTVASDEGLTYVAGDLVLLVGQTTASQNGPYVVGTVASTTAPLTRPDWWATGGAVPNGFTFEVAHGGTWYGDSRWKCTCTGAKVIGTDDPALYPNVWRQVVTLAAGTYTIGFGSTATPDEPLFLLSTTRSQVQLSRDTAGTTTNTVEYYAPVASRVAGKAGTAVVVVTAAVAAGTINNADVSTINVTITNF
jgi:hypothetical protein